MATPRETVLSGTASEILDIAERLVQDRGFNGFSYADVSAEMGVSKAALHYHFPGKAELGESIVARYTDRFEQALAVIDAGEQSAPEKLLAYCEIYRGTLRGRRMCLCGMLAAEYNTLVQPMRAAIARFFKQNQAWLAKLLETGRRAGSLRYTGPVEQAAQTIIASLEGGMLVARPYHGTAVLDAVIDRILADFVPV
jgi:TetR/AcrR family transcriptional repressor of nem operon